jgi:hypothetical protein
MERSLRTAHGFCVVVISNRKGSQPVDVSRDPFANSSIVAVKKVRHESMGTFLSGPMGSSFERLPLFAIIVLLVLAPLSTAQTWVSAVAATTTATGATITWFTAVPADSQVKYDVTTSYGMRTAINSYRTTAHSTSISGLTPATTYHFRTLSRDSGGVLVTSLDYTFNTKAVPISVSVSPASASVPSGTSRQFTASVTNSSNQSVTWSATLGTISAAGLFQAPTVTTDQNVTVKATSVADTSKSATASVTVKAPAPVLAVAPSSLTFSAQQGGGNPAPASLSVSNTGGGTLTYSVSSAAAWLAVTPNTGSAPKVLQATPAITGLVPGTFTGHITISAPGAGNSPITVTVVLTITAVTLQHSVDLSWNSSTTSNVVSYSAYRSTSQGGPYILVGSAITGLTYTDSTVQSGVTYYYVVTAFNDAAQESVYSNEAKAVVPRQPQRSHSE